MVDCVLSIVQRPSTWELTAATSEKCDSSALTHTESGQLSTGRPEFLYILYNIYVFTRLGVFQMSTN